MVMMMMMTVVVQRVHKQFDVRTASFFRQLNFPYVQGKNKKSARRSLRCMA